MSRSRTRALTSLVVALLCGATAQAADISMTADEASDSSSFNGAGKWSNAAAPSAGNNYFNANFLLRTPATGSSYAFGGDSLTITSDQAIGAQLNDALMFKGAASATITVNNFTINGGNLRHGNSESQTFTLAGNRLTVGSSGMGVHLQGLTIISAPVFGAGEIKIVDNGNINLPTANRSCFTLTTRPT